MNPLASNQSLPQEPTVGWGDALVDQPGNDGAEQRHEKSSDIGGEHESRRVRLSRRVPLSALATLLRITAQRQLRGRRLLIFSLLFALPIVFGLLAQRFEDPYRAADVEAALIFGLIPQALVPLTALLFASGMVQDDVEEQTLTYLLIRPIPRWLIYVVKVLSTWLVTSLLASVFTAAALYTVYWGAEDLNFQEVGFRAMLISSLLLLSVFAYIAIFGALSLLVRRSLVLGVAYTAVFEGLLANIDFVVRHVTIMYYVRTLSVRWLGLPGIDWSIDPQNAPDVATCLGTLIGAGCVLTILGSWIFSVKEFRVKTPEGS
jgi:ABC-2 type transport system permease protein